MPGEIFHMASLIFVLNSMGPPLSYMYRPHHALCVVSSWNNLKKAAIGKGCHPSGDFNNKELFLCAVSKLIGKQEWKVFSTVLPSPYSCCWNSGKVEVCTGHGKVHACMTEEISSCLLQIRIKRYAAFTKHLMQPLGKWEPLASLHTHKF